MCRFAFIAAVLGCCLVAPAVRPQSLPTFTAAQAQRGHAAYLANCAGLCHGDDLDNGDAMPIKGDLFLANWGGKPLDELFMLFVTKMPPASPNSLSASTYADILAYVLSQNRVKPSDVELPADAQALKQMAPPK